MFRKNKPREYYTVKAREEGYPARSVYKLKEIDEKYHIFRKGDKVLDLGCAPGSWLIYIAKKIRNQGKVIGLDIKNIKKINGFDNIFFAKVDILRAKKEEFEKINKKFGLKDYNVIVSDLAPKTCGIKFVDSAKSYELSKKALDIAKIFLVDEGNFVCKIFEGEMTNNFLEETKKNFKFVKKFRPKAIRKRSKEIYIVAKDFQKLIP